MHALFISADSDTQEKNTSYYRTLGPAKWLTRAGHTIAHQSMPGFQGVVDGKFYNITALDWRDIPDTVLVERAVTPERVRLLRAAGARRIIVTFDDHYGKLPEYARARRYWGQYFEDFKRALAMVEGVIVPSHLLADAFRPYAPTIQVVPNFLDDDLWSGPPSDGSTQVLGWGGSEAHVAAWSQRPLTRTLEGFLSQHSTWSLRLYGEAPRAVLPAHLLRDSRDLVAFDEWPRRVAEFAVGIAPLAGEYDNYRSSLKALEFACAGVPYVASAADPYTTACVKGGVIARLSQWPAVLERLATDCAYRAELIEAGRAWAATMRMSAHTSDYEQILWGPHA